VQIRLIEGIKRRLARHIDLITKYKDPNTIFIYQMGKVGSTSLEQALPNAVHIHAFYSKNHTCPVRQKGLAKFGLKHFIYRAEQEIVSLLLRRAFKKRSFTKIITLVRDPQARNISMFFHDLDAYIFSAHTNCLNTRRVPLPTRCQNSAMLADIYNQEFDHDYALRWFDSEFLPMTGINVYDSCFDKDKGFAYLTSSKVEVMCIRTDKLKYCMSEVSLFVDQEIVLDRLNQANEKWYGEIYQGFITSYELPEERKHKINSSQFFQHFFDSSAK
tara:strand:- start:10360 stop:11178 length:819 start_codon:yes stop_codon:yes gene_type:complete